MFKLNFSYHPTQLSELIINKLEFNMRPRATFSNMKSFIWNKELKQTIIAPVNYTAHTPA